jgi:transposase
LVTEKIFTIPAIKGGEAVGWTGTENNSYEWYQHRVLAMLAKNGSGEHKMIFQRKGLEIFIFKEPIDMRFGFHKLTGLVRAGYGMPKLLGGHIFVFFGNNRTRIKLLFFDGTGLCLLIKRLEQGRFMWVRDLELEQVSFRELEQLLHGSQLVKSKLGVMPKKKFIA